MRNKLFTESVLAQIAQWTECGLRPVEIAEKIGCTIGTLRVRCSHYGISLRQPSRSRRAGRIGPAPADLVLRLSDDTRAGIQGRARLLGLSDAELVSVLIETIDRHDLYSAVLDDNR
jgi:hypothetical protein